MWVFTVLTPIVSSAATWGTERPRAKACNTWRSRSDRTGAFGCACRRISPASAPASVGGDNALAACHLQHCFDDLRAAGVLREESGGALLQRLEDECAVGVGGQHEHACRQLVADDGTHDADAVDLGHLVVDQRHVGLLATDRLDGISPVLGFGDDLDPTVLVQTAGHAVTEERVIISNHHAHAGIFR